MKASNSAHPNVHVSTIMRSDACAGRELSSPSCSPYWPSPSTLCSCAWPFSAFHWCLGRWPVPRSSGSDCLWSPDCPSEAPWAWVHTASWLPRAGDLRGAFWSQYPGLAYRGPSSSLWRPPPLQTDSGSLCGSIRGTDLDQANEPEKETQNRCFPWRCGAALLTCKSFSKDSLTIKLLSLFLVPGFLIGLQFYNRWGSRTCQRRAWSDVSGGLGSEVLSFISIITAVLLFLF